MDRKRTSAAGLIAGVILALLTGLAQAQAPALTQPIWAELSPDQKAVLAPLEGEWDSMEAPRRRKWLGIAQRYQSMRGDEQARMQQRMKAWARLTPEERRVARQKYLELKKAQPETKEAVKQKWQTYKELPDSEKERLKAEAKAAKTKPARAVPAQTKPASSKPLRPTVQGLFDNPPVP